MAVSGSLLLHVCSSVRTSGTTEIRLLFAVDPRREAIFLVAGDKAGNWEGWYRQAIPLADERFTRHLAVLEKEEETGKR